MADTRRRKAKPPASGTAADTGADTGGRSILGLLATALAAGGALAVAALLRARPRTNPAEHVPTDLMGDTRPGPGDRAPDAFRPDPTAPVPPEMRESLRPATGPATGFAADRGSTVNEGMDAA